MIDILRYGCFLFLGLLIGLVIAFCIFAAGFTGNIRVRETGTTEEGATTFSVSITEYSLQEIRDKKYVIFKVRKD